MRIFNIALIDYFHKAKELVMTVISRRIIVPAQGKAEAALAQAKSLAEQATHAGTKTRLFKVIMGEDAGNLEMFVRFENFQDGINGFQTLAASASVNSARAQLEGGNVQSISGPYVYRTVFGEPTAQPVLVQRQYQISRANLQAAIAMLPDAKAAFSAGTGMTAVVPVFAPEMDRLAINYYMDSLQVLGKELDENAMSPAFQNVVAKAAQLGTLISGRVLVVV
ncbi:hypothetical protein B9Z46_10890 [Limnohabitans sp. Hippo4]|nr:hypothetical protein B9Z46_10890 [Limnohabitans sp. Hippo4]